MCKRKTNYTSESSVKNPSGKSIVRSQIIKNSANFLANIVLNWLNIFNVWLINKSKYNELIKDLNRVTMTRP